MSQSVLHLGVGQRKSHDVCNLDSNPRTHPAAIVVFGAAPRCTARAVFLIPLATIRSQVPERAVSEGECAQDAIACQRGGRQVVEVFVPYGALAVFDHDGKQAARSSGHPTPPGALELPVKGGSLCRGGGGDDDQVQLGRIAKLRVFKQLQDQRRAGEVRLEGLLRLGDEGH